MALASAGVARAATTTTAAPPAPLELAQDDADPARLSEREAEGIALGHPKVSDWLDRYPPDPTTDASFRDDSRTWVVKVWSGDAGQIVQAVVEDTTGRVREAWTGPAA